MLRCSTHLFRFAKVAMPKYEEPWKIRELVQCIWYACVSKNHNDEKKKGSNRFSSTEINWGLATHLEYRALSSGLHTYPHVHWSVNP